MNSKTIGSTYVILAAVIWGASGVAIQLITQNGHFSASWLVSIRLFSAGIMMLCYEAFKAYRRKSLNDMTAVFQNGRDILQLFIFSVFGAGLMSASYSIAIAASNAATATFLQYTCPAMIVLAELVIEKKRPEEQDIICVVLAITGVFLIATHGHPGELTLSGNAFLWGMIAAASMAFYSMYPQRLMRKYPRGIILGWSFLISGILLVIAEQPWKELSAVTPYIGLLILYVSFFGTLIAFNLYTAGIAAIGAARASILATLEPLVSALLAFFAAGVSFQTMDYVGAVCILAITFVLAIPKPEKQKY